MRVGQLNVGPVVSRRLSLVVRLICGSVMLVSLKDFLTSGQFGPVLFGCDRLQLESTVGQPEATGGVSRKYRRPVIWKYGDVEFFFSRTSNKLETVHLDRFTDANGTPQGWGGLQIDPWVIRRGIAEAEFADALEAAGIAYTVRPKPEWIQETVVVASGVEIGFKCAPDEFSDFVGLFHLTRQVIGA